MLKHGQWNLPLKVNPSVEAIGFLNDMLQYNHKRRISISELVNHPYLKKDPTSLKSLTTNPKFKTYSENLVLISNNNLKFNIKDSE